MNEHKRSEGSLSPVAPHLTRANAEGEAAAARVKHGTWGAIKRHRKAGEVLCDACKGYQRTYNRDYARIRQQSPTYAARKAAANRLRQRQLFADPARVVQFNAARRRRRRMQQEADRAAVDPIAVERACDFHRPLPRLNRAEKISAYKEMMRLRVPRRQVVERLRISWATAQLFDARVSENYLHRVCTDGQNDSEAEQDCSPARPLTDTPAYPGGRLMPSIAAHPGDSCQRVAG